MRPRNAVVPDDQRGDHVVQGAPGVVGELSEHDAHERVWLLARPVNRGERTVNVCLRSAAARCREHPVDLAHEGVEQVPRPVDLEAGPGQYGVRVNPVRRHIPTITAT